MDCKQVTLSGHAIRRMFERAIAVDDVHEVVQTGQVASRLPHTEVIMKCVICKVGETQPGTATVTLQGGDTTVILKGVPAEVCDNCGEYYLSEEVSRQLLERAEEGVQRGVEVHIVRFAA